MRDILLTIAIVGLLPLCVYRPWLGVVTWSWFGLMNPHRLTWDFAYTLPFGQWIAIATLFGFFIHVIRNGLPSGALKSAQLRLLLLLWILFTVSTVFALQPEDAWMAWEQITKILLMTFLSVCLIDDKEKLRYLLLVIAFSVGFFGFKGGIFAALTGGQYRVWGPEGSFIEDNNALALALNMTLPVIYYLAATESRRWLRNLLYITFGLSIISVLFTYSRGGVVGLAVVLGLIFLSTRLRWKIVVAFVVILAIPIVMTLPPERWMDRMSTLQNYEQDGSAMSRLEGWKAASRLAMDHPLTGGGFGALNDYDTFIKYNPGVLEQAQRVGGVHASGIHSIYFEVLAENGIPALVVFLSLCGFTILSSRRLIKKGSRSSSPELAIAYGRMLLTSIIAYLVCGTFLEFVSFDLFYQIIAITCITSRLLLEPLPTSAVHPAINRA